jgi:hypothetical protein
MNAVLRPMAELAESHVIANKEWFIDTGRSCEPFIAYVQSSVDEAKAGRDVATLLGLAGTVQSLRGILRRDSEQKPEGS